MLSLRMVHLSVCGLSKWMNLEARRYISLMVRGKV